MPRRLHPEPLSGGLVTARDPSLLQTGELQLAKNAVYRPDSDAIQPWLARLQFRTAFDVTDGKRLYISLLSGSEAKYPIVLAAINGKWWASWSDEGETWNEIFAGTEGFARYWPFKIVSWRDRWFICDRSIEAKEISVRLGRNVTIVKHGMVPMEATEISLAGSGNAWDAGTPTGTYFYWLTEYDSVRNIESAVSAVLASDFRSLTVKTTDGADVTIDYGSSTYGELRNPHATHWRLYRGLSVTAVGTAENPFPIGHRVPVKYTPPGTVGTSTIVTDIPIPEDIDALTVEDIGRLAVTSYPTIVFQGQIPDVPATGVSRDMPPPELWSTGAVFEDSLVINDLTLSGSNTRVWYSIAGLPHSFPQVYFIELSLRPADFVTSLDRVGDRLICGTRKSVRRINFLPRETDSVASRERVENVISSTHGIVGPQATALLTLEDGAPRLAYVSDDGLYMTDGFSTRQLSIDLKWSETVQGAEVNRDDDTLNTRIEEIILINVEHLQSLMMFYAPPDATVRTQALLFSYAPRHLKRGRLKASGPVEIGAVSAAYDEALRTLYTSGYDGRVMLEDQSLDAEGAFLVDPCGMAVQTRIVHPAGLHNEVSLERLFLLTDRTERDETPEKVAILQREPGKPTNWSEVAVRIETGVLWRKEKHTRAQGVGVEFQGFAPLHLVGLEYQPREGK